MAGAGDPWSRACWPEKGKFNIDLGQNCNWRLYCPGGYEVVWIFYPAGIKLKVFSKLTSVYHASEDLLIYSNNKYGQYGSCNCGYYLFELKWPPRSFRFWQRTYWWMGSLVLQTVKNLPAIQVTWVWSLGWEDPLEEGMATHYSILAGESHRERSLAGYSPWGCKESDMTKHILVKWVTKHKYPQALLGDKLEESLEYRLA